MSTNLVNLDHLVIAASSLEQGVDYVRKMLGVDIPFGGVHSAMGTHNHLMQLGNSVFLEVIAINNEIAAQGPEETEFSAELKKRGNPWT